jgi:hypothetical protein
MQAACQASRPPGAGRWGRKPLFLFAFGALCARGLLYTVAHSPAALIAVQCMDGLGAGVFGVVATLIIADLTKGTGRFKRRKRRRHRGRHWRPAEQQRRRVHRASRWHDHGVPGTRGHRRRRAAAVRIRDAGDARARTRGSGPGARRRERRQRRAGDVIMLSWVHISDLHVGANDGWTVPPWPEHGVNGTQLGRHKGGRTW